MTPMIGVFSGRPGVAEALARVCPGYGFADAGDPRDAARIAVIDSDQHAQLESHTRKSLVRVVLFEDPLLSTRRHGELRVAREIFLANPAEYIAFAADLADAAVHASQLEAEIGYLSQVHELIAMVDAGAVSERITRTVLNLLGRPKGTLFLHDPRLERYVVSFSNDESYRETGEFLPGIPPDLLQHALASGRSFAQDDALRIVVMPLQVEHDLLGAIRVPLGDDPLIDEETAASVSRYLTAVAQVLGNIYQLTRSRDLALRDDLTKAFNRRFFDSYLDEEMERSRRYGSLFSIIFLDLDDLKMVNNFYGHLTGSRTLQEVAKRILAAVRGIDKVIRFGGDEFCIVLPQTDQDQAIAVANRIRKSLTATPLQLDKTIEISITASFGIATYPTHSVTKEGLIRQADAAMYRVKTSTKNAVGMATVEEAPREAYLPE